MLKNAIGLFVVTIIIFFLFLPSYTRMQDLKQRNTEYKKQIEILQARNTQLKKEKALLENDPVYLEKVAREKMGLVREGEVVYKLVPVVEPTQNKMVETQEK